MRKTELAKYKQLLEAKRQELSKGLQRDPIALEKHPEVEEEAQMSAQQELAAVNRTQDAALMRQILAALDRIRDGGYGICLSCEKEIPPRRLTAVPWAAYCTRCQETMEEQPEQMIARQEETVPGQPSGERQPEVLGTAGGKA